MTTMVLVNRLLSWQGYYGPGKTVVVLARPLSSWQDHCGPVKTIVVLYKTIVALAGSQLAIMVRPGPQLAIMVRPGPQLASCGPARTTSTKEVKTQTSMVMHTSFGLF